MSPLKSFEVNAQQKMNDCIYLSIFIYYLMMCPCFEEIVMRATRQYNNSLNDVIFVRCAKIMNTSCLVYFHVCVNISIVT